MRQGLIIWKRDIEDRREHPAVTCNINCKGVESEQSPHALACLLAPVCRIIRPLARGVTDTSPLWPWLGPGPQLESLRGGIPSQRASSCRQGCSRTLNQYSPVHLTRQGGQARLRDRSDMLMPKSPRHNVPSHYGKSPNRRYSRTPAGASGASVYP